MASWFETRSQSCAPHHEDQGSVLILRSDRLAASRRMKQAELSARLGLAKSSDLQRALDSLHAITLDDVAGTHVAVILERHAAFLARRHFLHFILEALQRRQLALMHHD